MIIHAETRLIFVIWHMKQTRPCQTRVTHCDSLEARGMKAQRHFFIDTFFLVIRGKRFYSRTSSPTSYVRSTGMRISRQYKVHKVADFFYTIIETWSHRLRQPGEHIWPALHKPYALPPKLPPRAHYREASTLIHTELAKRTIETKNNVLRIHRNTWVLERASVSKKS